MRAIPMRGFSSPDCRSILHPNACAALDLDASRLELIPACRHTNTATFGRVDIVLDPLPFSGATTTLDALYRAFRCRHCLAKGRARGRAQVCWWPWG